MLSSRGPALSAQRGPIPAGWSTSDLRHDGDNRLVEGLRRSGTWAMRLRAFDTVLLCQRGGRRRRAAVHRAQPSPIKATRSSSLRAAAECRTAISTALSGQLVGPRAQRKRFAAAAGACSPVSRRAPGPVPARGTPGSGNQDRHHNRSARRIISVAGHNCHRLAAHLQRQRVGEALHDRVVGPSSPVGVSAAPPSRRVSSGRFLALFAGQRLRPRSHDRRPRR